MAAILVCVITTGIAPIIASGIASGAPCVTRLTPGTAPVWSVCVLKMLASDAVARMFEDVVDALKRFSNVRLDNAQHPACHLPAAIPGAMPGAMPAATPPLAYHVV